MTAIAAPPLTRLAGPPLQAFFAQLYVGWSEGVWWDLENV